MVMPPQYCELEVLVADGVERGSDEDHGHEEDAGIPVAESVVIVR
jgi:hypothetical protein